MFAGIDVAQDQPTRRWTALTSFTLQAAILAAAVVYSTLYPQKLSQAFFHHRIFVPVSSGELPIGTTTQASGQAGAHPFVAPIRVVNGTSFHPANPSSGSNVIGAPPNIGVIGLGTGDVPFTMPSEHTQPVLVHPTVRSHVVRTSTMMEGLLIHKVEPIYPPIARMARVEGSVKIRAVISRQGMIEQAQVLNGSPLLAPAALDAIRQWRYKPYILNGEPVEVETQVTVNFTLGR